ncbi:MAG: ThiF family adenylyltransferase [Solirubrobacterales bacterium]
MRIATDPHAALRQERSPSGLGCVTAAVFALSEAFKDHADVKESRRSRVGLASFCPVTLADDLSMAPPLSSGCEIRACLVGLGAIGSAHVLILRNLDVAGELILCDPERFELPNLGTYSFGTRALAESKPLKVDLAEALLDKFAITKVPGRASDLIASVNARKIEPPRIVLAGLDSAASRYEVQRLYPDHLIDGGTGDTTVTLHHARHGSACIQCLVPELLTKHSAAERLSLATGIPLRLIIDGAAVFTEEHVIAARPEFREELRAYVGKPICSMPDAGKFSNSDAAGFDPAAPFVAQLAACLDIGRLVALKLGMPVTSNLVQADPLLGPGFVDMQSRPQRSECVCRTRAKVIDELRESWRSDAA